MDLIARLATSVVSTITAEWVVFSWPKVAAVISNKRKIMMFQNKDALPPFKTTYCADMCAQRMVWDSDKRRCAKGPCIHRSNGKDSVYIVRCADNRSGHFPVWYN